MGNIKISALVISSLLAMVGPAQAANEKLRCKLMSKSIVETQVKSPDGQSVLSAFRDGGICIFEDGRLADKLFVFSNLASEDFSNGSYAGFSVYTFENGDSLKLSFIGNWGNGGNNGDYKVLGGTGRYEGATGTGNISGLDSPWEGTNWFDIAIDVTTGG